MYLLVHHGICIIFLWFNCYVLIFNSLVPLQLMETSKLFQRFLRRIESFSVRWTEMTGIKFNYLVKNSGYEQPKDGLLKTDFELWDTDADTVSVISLKIETFWLSWANQRWADTCPCPKLNQKISSPAWTARTFAHKWISRRLTLN